MVSGGQCVGQSAVGVSRQSGQLNGFVVYIAVCAVGMYGQPLILIQKKRVTVFRDLALIYNFYHRIYKNIFRQNPVVCPSITIFLEMVMTILPESTSGSGT